MTEKDRLQRVAELTSLLLDGRLGRAEKDELNELLRGDPDACERYLDLAETHAALVHDRVSDELAATTRATIRDRQPSALRFRGLRPWIAVAAVVAILLLVNAILLLQNRPSASAEPMAEEEWIAVLSRTVDASWENRSFSHAEGDALVPGELRLTSGLIQFELFSGVSVIVEGPARLDLKSAREIALSQGRLSALIPEPAEDFTITTPDFRASDLGAEFSLSVDPESGSELYVLKGTALVLAPDGSEKANLTEGGAIRGARGKIEIFDGVGSDFIDRKTLLGMAEASGQSRYLRWKTQRAALRKDPDTLVFFDFEDSNPWDRQLLNRNEEGPNAAIIGAQWTQGRWPEKGALEFKRIIDRVRLDVPGEFDEITFSAWVRVEGLDRWLSSLLLTDGFDLGEPHWQISDSGELILGIQTGKGSPNTISPPVIHPEDLGRWIHLAVTASRISGKVVHYVDGEAVTIDQREDLPPFRLGGSEIGNWHPKKLKHPLRSLNGRIDEFLVMRRALTPEEIRAIFASGQ